jgi:transcriptional regulator with GAF, ATPase, and Fis domain
MEDSRAMSNLLVIKGANIGVRYALGAHTSLGRAPENQIQLHDANVSRFHCEIVQVGQSYQIRDKESRNGVLVNGERVQEKTLLRNDEIAIGSTVFLFNTDLDLKNTRFSNKRVLFSASSPAEDTLMRPGSPRQDKRREKEQEALRAESAHALLCQLGEIGSSSLLPLPEALEHILKTLLRVFNAERGCLLNWDAVLQNFVPLVVVAEESALAVPQSVVRCVLEEKHAILTPVPSSETQLPRALRSVRVSRTETEALCVPFLRGGQVTGLFYIEIPKGSAILLHDVHLLQAVANLTQLAVEHSRAVDDLEQQKARVPKSGIQFLGESPAFLQAQGLIWRVASSDSTVLLTGETGTGKEMAAREIHRLSKRASYPFVAINCAAIPSSLIEDELFGHERGAFTGASGMRRGLIENAHGGTLFLDEIGEMDLSAQTKLLRFLQDHVVTRIGGHQAIQADVRVIAATNADLKVAVAQKHFRQDLWFRLNVFGIHLPPLRERSGDIAILAQHFLGHYAAEFNRPSLTLSEAALDALQTYDWPGNVRELQNALERAILMCDGARLEPGHFGFPFSTSAALSRASLASPASAEDTSPGLNAGALFEATETLADAERRCIEQALKASNWNQIQAAQRLQIHRNTLHKKIQEYHLEP